MGQQGDGEDNGYSNDEENNESGSEKPGRIWCADVEYNNPNTGTDNTYQLDVVVESGELVEIE